MKHIVITGVSKGIGYSLLKEFLLKHECRILALGQNPDVLVNKLSKKHQQSVKAVFLDLNDPNFEGTIYEVQKFLLGRVDILVNNAGFLVNKPFASISNSDLEVSLNVNFKGPFQLIQKLEPFFKTGSHIVNITSMGAINGTSKFSGLSAYSPSKGALTILTELLAVELAPKSISVNGLALGAVETEMLRNAFPNYTAPTSPEEISGFISYFCMEGHNFFNGKILPVSSSNP